MNKKDFIKEITSRYRVSMSYSGHTRTMYISGPSAMIAASFANLYDLKFNVVAQ